ncbi:MAG: bifunctional diaminohydroxyphosphoribosylaminopyrimidine deaminase/5-amino-6-(5-phosphoribosylamino)uracil reductase RibD [Natronosporangium sp.]
MASEAESTAMREAAALSALGLGTTSPNPPVGCVVLDRHGQPVGSGYHSRKGDAHAETQALASAGDQANGGTAVVTLEPCNHDGLTPACRRVLLDAGITRVVIGVIDPTSRGEGGAAALRAAEVEVEVGVALDEVRLVLEPWLTATARRWPYVTAAAVAEQAVDELRGGVDCVLFPDGRIEEGIPGGHGPGMLRLPSLPWDFGDSAANLATLFGGGVRTLLVIGDSEPSRALHALELVDRAILDLPREARGTLLPADFGLESVSPTGDYVRITVRRSPAR